MIFNDIKQQFQCCKNWEDRYRLLVKLSKQLPIPDEATLTNLTEIHGCESRLWFRFQKTPRFVQSYSEARLMQGILFILNCILLEIDENELRSFNIESYLNELQLSTHLSSTRLNGLRQLNEIIRQS